MLPPNILNYTIPGGIRLFFDPGTGEVDLGNMLDAEIASKTEELEHYSNRSGKRAKDAVWTLEEAVTINFKLDEAVIENMQKYFKGGDIELVGAGTDNMVDQKVNLNGLILSSLGKYGISAVTLRQFLDGCLVYDGAAYHDYSVEADSLAGTPFELLAGADDFVYFGKASKFKEIYLDLQTLGVYTGVAWEYWDGDEWIALAGVAGAGKDLDADGKINWTVPGDWAKKIIETLSLYWVRVKCATCTTPATCNSVRQDAVQNTDYIVDPGQASIDGRLVARVGRLAAGFLADGEEVKVSYTYTTWTSMRFPLAVSDFKKGAARLEVHPSLGRGNRFDVEIPLCLLKPNGNISLADNKVMDIPMSLEVLDNTNNTPDYPFGRYVALDEV